MRGRKPWPYRLREADRQYLHEILAEGQLMHRVAKRAQALLALDRGERIVEIVRWLDWSRMGLWDLWQRYHAWGVDAIVDGERSGRPPGFSPPAARADRADRLH